MQLAQTFTQVLLIIFIRAGKSGETCNAPEFFKENSGTLWHAKARHLLAATRENENQKTAKRTFPVSQHSVLFLIANEPIFDNAATEPLLSSLKAAGVEDRNIVLLDEWIPGSLGSQSTSCEADGKDDQLPNSAPLQKQQRFWTWFPWLKELQRRLRPEIEWFFLLTPHVRINFSNLENFLKKAQSAAAPRTDSQGTASTRSDSQPEGTQNETNESSGLIPKGRIFGAALLDDISKIKFFFFFNRTFSYPSLNNGVILHSSAVNDLVASVNQKQLDSFIFLRSIQLDPFFDTFKLFRDVLGETIVNIPEFCFSDAIRAINTNTTEFAQDRLPHPRDCITTFAPLDRQQSSTYKINQPTEGLSIGNPIETQRRYDSSTLSVSEILQRKSVCKELCIVVKTTENCHFTRIPQIKKLWANQESMKMAEGDVQNQAGSKQEDGGMESSSEPPLIDLLFMSDKNEGEIVDIGVGKGHCSKFYAILEHFYYRMPSKRFLFVADDDTLLNVFNVVTLLTQLTFSPDSLTARQRSVFPTEKPNPLVHARDYFMQAGSKPAGAGRITDTTPDCETPATVPGRAISPLYLGERFGYRHMASDNDFDYITAGPGIIIDRLAVQKILVECPRCRCGSPLDPDDMSLGQWFTSIGVPARHYQGFHQVTPEEYNPVALFLQSKTHLPISFHGIDVENFNETARRFSYLTEKA